MNPEPPEQISVTPRRDSRAARRLTLISACGGSGLLLLALVAVVLYPVLATPRDSLNERRSHYCLSNGKQLGAALLMYTQDYDGCYPPANAWEGGLWPYVKNTQVFICPQRPAVAGYAFNARLHLISEKVIPNPAAAPAIFESGLGFHNATDYLQSFLTPHTGKGTVVFADGHAQQLSVAPPVTAGLRKGRK